MSGRWISQIVVFGFIIVAADRGSAQDFSLAAEPAKKKFDAKVEALRAKYQTDIKVASTDYAAKLDVQIKFAIEKGDLDKVLAYKAEKEWIENGKLPMGTASSLKFIQPMRAAFEVKKKAANTVYEKAAKVAKTEFLADLETVVKEETKEGRIESALRVRETRKEVEKVPLPPAVVRANPIVGEKDPDKPETSVVPKPEPEKNPVAAQERRDYWVHTTKGIVFKLDKDGVWREKNPKTGIIEYKETARNKDYVEITKAGYAYRLYADHCEAKQGENNWEQAGKGKWE